ncbi:phosphohistidine phosphatase SixA [Marinomonas sp.]|jgi:phosphohistidine phosphatase|uniref:phosphohistidine phosphatase SixA n=1 Tax=Marinomonas sp. TaxID=1904862 RepID=UPI003CA4802B
MSSKKQLYVLRHGNAFAHGYERDDLRELTPEGVEEVKQTARAFNEQGERLDAVFVSPYVRAQQTAKYFLAELDQTDVEVQSCPLITPSGKELDVALWLNDQKAKSILLITHQPFAHQLVELLSDEPLPASFAMTTAALAALEGELFATACCQYRWIIAQ